MVSLVRRIRELVSRVTGISTPLFGLSWARGQTPESESAAPPGDYPVLTPAECAQILHVDEQVVIDQLESGDLRGFSVAGECRVTSNQVVRFLREQSRAKELEVFARRISDPRAWAVELQRHPEVMKEIHMGDYLNDSLGKFLQDALKTLDADRGDIPKD